MQSTAYAVIGLGAGDESKGSTVDFLCRHTGAKLVVRFNGGPQCGHNVVLPDGTHHEFAQFGSGSLILGVKTYLSRFMLIEPMALLREHGVLSQKTGRNHLEDLYIEESCPVITPWHEALNQAKEKARGAARHGSCGRGVGELRADCLSDKPVLVAGDCKHPHRTRNILEYIRAGKEREILDLGIDYDFDIDELISAYTDFYDRVQVVLDGHLPKLMEGPVIFEGAQGVLLDETHGFAPYNTWTDCTFWNAKTLLKGTHYRLRRIGCLRTYATRHGAGPFPTEYPSLPITSKGERNKTNPWQGHFRHGYFDLPMTKYALRCVGGVDGIALSHLDQMPVIQAADCYAGNGKYISEINGPSMTEELLHCVAPPLSWIQSLSVKHLEAKLGVPIVVQSRGPCWTKKSITGEGL